MVKLENAFSNVRVPKSTPQGVAGYDNARENIDPHIKTQVVNTRDVIAMGRVHDLTYGGSVQELSTTSINFVIDGGGSALTTGVKGFLFVPFDCIITKAALFADTTGSVVVDIWNDSTANFPPTDADSITSSTPLTISSGVSVVDTSLTGWDKTLLDGDLLAFNVDSCATITRVTVALVVVKH